MSCSCRRTAPPPSIGSSGERTQERAAAFEGEKEVLSLYEQGAGVFRINVRAVAAGGGPSSRAMVLTAYAIACT